MNLSRYLEVREIVLANAKRIEDSKRKSYTAGNDDVLHNFKSDSEFVGTRPTQNVLTHLAKQFRGIASYVKNPDDIPSETLLSRAGDLINYAVLMVATAMDEGRDTGVDWLHERSPLFDERYGFGHEPKASTLPEFSFVALAKSDEPTANVLNDYYSYTFGKDDV